MQKSNYIPETPLGQGENAGGEREDGLENRGPRGSINGRNTTAWNRNANGVSSTNRSHCKCRGNTGECRGRASTDDYAKVSIDKGGS